MAEFQEDTKRNVEVLNEMMAKRKMWVYSQTTKMMVVYIWRVGGTCHLVVDGVEVDQMQTAKIYLGPCLMKKHQGMMRMKTELGQQQK